MISNELLEEIIFVSLKGNFIDKDILKKVFDENYKILDKKTQENFNGLFFAEIKDNEFRGTCIPQQGIIVIDLLKIYEECNKKEILMLKNNLCIVTTLLHELEHLKEPYKISKNNFESKLLKYSNIENQKLYNNFYNCIPCEKIAYSNFCKILLENIKKYPKFKEEYFDEYAFANNNYIKTTKLGYYYIESEERYNIPLFEFLRGTNQFHKLSELFVVKQSSENSKTSISRLDVNTKMKYGLPVTKKDIEEINKQKILIKSIK